MTLRFTIASLALIVTALGIGLGLGLPRRDEIGSSLNVKCSNITNILSFPSLIHVSDGSGSGVFSISTAQTFERHIYSAVTLPGGDRELYFQDTSRAVRKAFYWSRSKSWQAFARFELAPKARSHNPLAAIGFDENSSGVSECTTLRFHFPLTHLQMILFYVHFGQDTLDCIGLWGNMPQIVVALGSRHMSSANVSATANRIGLLLVYGDPSHQFNIMYGNGQRLRNSGSPLDGPDGYACYWTWHNVTGDFYESFVSQAGPCAVTRFSPSSLFCLESKVDTSIIVAKEIMIDASGNLTFRTSSFSLSQKLY